jgi:hypothetical protein
LEPTGDFGLAAEEGDEALGAVHGAENAMTN